MSLTRTTWHVRADADWLALAPRDPAAVMAVRLADRFHAKQGRSTARWPVAGRLVVYLKRHHREPRWRGWLAALTGKAAWSTAVQEYRRLRWAAARGFAVPRAVAAGAGIGPWGRLQGFVAVEDLVGMRPLHELIPLAQASLSPARFQSWKRGLIAELARLATELHGRRFFHKDLYLCHFFAPERFAKYPPVRWTGEVAMIDLHRLARHRLSGRWWQLKDLAQLLYSSDVAGVTPRDRLRFWKLYAGPGRRRGLGPWVRRFVLVRWNNYRGHNAPRKAAA